MKPKVRLILLVSLVALLIFVGFGIQYVLVSPQYSLYKMYQTVAKHDYENFKKYVDVDSVANNVIDKAMESAKKDTETTPGNSWEQLGATFALGLFESMKPGLKATLTSTIQKAVEQGDFKSDYKPKNLFQVFKMISVKKDGKVADITIKANGVSDLHLKMRNVGKIWQVFDMDLPAPKEGEASQGTTEAKFGERVDIGQGWFLTVDSPADFTNPNQFEQPKEGNKYVALKVIYENTTDKPDSFYVGNLKLKDDKDFSYSYTYGGKDPKLDSGDLEAKGKIAGYVTFEVSSDSKALSLIYSGSKSVIFK